MQLLEEMLKSLKFYPHLNEKDLEFLREKAYKIIFKPGDKVIKSGKTAGAFFMIAKGTLSVRAREDDREVLIGKLGPGDFFGATALLMGGTRPWDIAADDEAVVFVMGKQDFLELVSRNPGIKGEIQDKALERRRIAIGVPEEKERERHEKSFLGKLKRYFSSSRDS